MDLAALFAGAIMLPFVALLLIVAAMWRASR